MSRQRAARSASGLRNAAPSTGGRGVATREAVRASIVCGLDGTVGPGTLDRPMTQTPPVTDNMTKH